MARRRGHVPDGAGDDVAGLFKKFVPGLRKQDAPGHTPDVPDHHRSRPAEPRDVGDATPKDKAAYDRIRNDTGDTTRMADNTGLPKDVLDRAKRNLFLDEHRVQMPDGSTQTGRFTPDKNVADLWDKANSPDMSPEDRERFRKLVAHEYVESKLMERGLPYRSDHHDYWNSEDYGPGVANATADHHGAHDLAPNEGSRGPFSHYGRMEMDAPDMDMAKDLSNLDDVVDAIWRGRKR